MKYEVRVTREDGWWMVHIPGIDGLTQARRLADAAAEARSYIVVDQDVAPSTVDVELISVKVDGHEYAADITAVEDARAKARQSEENAALKARTLAAQLAAANVPVRDIGTALGVSYQRAHQLARP